MTSENHKIYVFHRSYFCGKMLAFLRYKEIPHTPIYKTLGEIGDDIVSNTGLRQLPVIVTPSGKWMNDTTPMMEWFEQQNVGEATLPSDPVNAFLVRLLEDYADEWLWRPAILSRWENTVDRHLYMKMFVKEFVGGFWASNPVFRSIAGLLVRKHQNDKFLYGDGMTKQNREHVWSIYTNTLDRLEAIFQQQPYLLGEKPCMADFGFFGSMFWHFGNDPTPNRIMQERAPGVYEWTARMWNMTASKATGKSFAVSEGAAPENWQPLLKDVCENYLPYLHQNALAYDAGKPRFDHSIEGYAYPGMHVSPYRVWCRERLKQALDGLSKADQANVQNILEPLGGWHALTADQHIKSNYDPENIAPFCTPGEISLKYKLIAPFVGSNHIQTVRAWAKKKV